MTMTYFSGWYPFVYDNLVFNIVAIFGLADKLTSWCVQLHPEEDGEQSMGNNQVTVSGEDDGEGMDVEHSSPVPEGESTATSRPTRASILTEEEIADGWQDAPARKGRRSKN
jgi:hypothetical protein